MSLPTVTHEWRNPEGKGHHAFKFVETPLPPLKSDDVLVKIHACSLQGTDIPIAAGYYPAAPNVVPLSDCAGEVIAVGDSVTSWKVGDRVSANRCLDHVHGPVTPKTMASSTGFTIDGVLTEFKAFKSHSLVRIPEHLSYEEASTLSCTAVTAWNCLYGPTPIKPGDTLLVQGTGGISLSAVQLAVPAGVRVIATSGSDEKLEKLKKLGVAHTINYKTTPDWDAEVLKLTNGEGVDHIIEVGGSSLAKSYNCVKMNGWIHAAGFAGGASPADFSIQGPTIMKSVLYRGVFIGPVTAFEALNKFITYKQLRPIIYKTFAFDQVAQAFDCLASGEHFGKVVIKVTKN